jgi:elongation factor Ts
MASHYKQIDGKKYAASLLEAADKMTAGQGDGRISKEDAERLFLMLGKDHKYTDLEKETMAFIRDNYKFTEAGNEFIRKEIRSWAATRGHKNAYKVSMDDIKALRQMSGAGIKDCKNALKENDGDMDSAMDWLRTKGISRAAKKSSRTASEGMIHSYIHAGSRLGVILEVNCETDFVARTDEFKGFVDDLAMHIAASRPEYVSQDDIPEDIVNKETEIQVARVVEEGKPKHIAETRIVPGRITKWKKEISLLDQLWIHDDDNKATVNEILNNMIHKTGENIKVRRFVIFVLGEGLKKKVNNFAEEVASMTGSN